MASWGPLLDDGPGVAPPAWRLAWCIHGIPDPLPPGEYRDCFEAVAAAYGLGALVDGLRHAAGIPACHGSGVDVSRLAALAAGYGRRVAA